MKRITPENPEFDQAAASHSAVPPIFAVIPTSRGFAIFETARRVFVAHLPEEQLGEYFRKRYEDALADALRPRHAERPGSIEDTVIELAAQALDIDLDF